MSWSWREGGEMAAMESTLEINHRWPVNFSDKWRFWWVLALDAHLNFGDIGALFTKVPSLQDFEASNTRHCEKNNFFVKYKHVEGGNGMLFQPVYFSGRVCETSWNLDFSQILSLKQVKWNVDRCIHFTNSCWIEI